MINRVVKNLEANGITAEEFVVSTDRLVEAAVVSQDDELMEDVVDRTSKLAGVSEASANWFVAWRIAIGLDKAVRSIDKERF